MNPAGIYDVFFRTWYNQAMSTLLLGLDRDKLPEASLAKVRDLARDYTIVISKDEQEIQTLRDDIEICVGNPATRLLIDAPNVRWCQLWSAGADWLFRLPDIHASSAVITTAAGVHPEPIGEHVFAMILSLARRFPELMVAQQERTWHKPDRVHIVHEVIRVREVYGSTLLILGAGTIGTELARLAKAFKMTVLGIRNDPSKTSDDIDEMHAPDALHELLPRADVVVSILPLTPVTEHVMNADAFAAMKPGALFINVGRGKTVDEHALIQALQQGHLGGAGLDVFEVEPLPEASPLWKMPNVMITPHCAGSTPSYQARAMDIFVDNLERYLQGKPLKNVVDVARGY
jgi:phosphoglycerate dehydrogenase-like enzyme